MGLFFPPALSLKNLVGGYNSNADFNTLGDNQTNDARNMEFTRINTARERNGYVRILNSALTELGVREAAGGTAREIKGHYQLVKQQNEVDIKREIVAAGPNLFNYNSATAAIIMTGLKDDSSPWFFEQIQSPTDGSDDIIVGVNGLDSPILWNGTDASASFLSSVTGSSGVTTGKFIASLFGRIYIGNITDTADVDSTSKIILSGFDTDGVPTPHIFPSDLFFYVGGSDRYGAITGMVALNGELIIFKRNATYKFTPAGGRTLSTTSIADLHAYSLVQMDQNIGCIAPGSIATIGNAIMFLSEYGVHAFDGNQFEYIGGSIEQDLKNINFSRKNKAYGIFHRAKNQYWLSMSAQSVNHNNTVFVFDISNKVWFPPYTNMKANIMSNFENVYGEDKILSGDHNGYLYHLDKGTADGKEIGFNIIPTTISTSGSVFNFDFSGLSDGGDGVLGLSVWATDGLGSDDKTIRTIIQATNTQIKVDPAFGSNVNSGTTLAIGGIDSYIRTKDFAIENNDFDKLYRQVSVRSKQLGNFDYKMNYIIDFREFSRAGSSTISQLNNNYITFGVCTTFENSGLWGPAPPKIQEINLRAINTQPLVGKYFAMRFFNRRANEPFELYNLDVLAKVIGRRR